MKSNPSKVEQLLLSKGCTIDWRFGGCSCGDGWLPIIEHLVDDLLALGWNGEVHQVKEKFGGLRFYIGGTSTKIRDRVHQAEEESFQICEDCGTTEGVTRDLLDKSKEYGWIKTMCDPCRDVRIEDYKRRYNGED